MVSLSPAQLHALDFRGLTNDTQIEYFVPRPPEKPQEQGDQKLSEKIREAPLKGSDTESSGTNWWLWGGLGLAVISVGVIALVAGGSKSGGGGSPAIATGNGTVSW